jgi:hypothetical protein
VKKRTGADFPVWVRLDGEELRTEGGITVADAIAAAKLAEQAGADAISMSAYATITTGCGLHRGAAGATAGSPGGLCSGGEEGSRVPVIAAGRISPEMANEGIERGLFDFVAMGRKLLADPDLPNKLAANRRQDVRPCIYCYVCVSQIFINQRVKCAVNAQVGPRVRVRRSRRPPRQAPRRCGRRRPRPGWRRRAWPRCAAIASRWSNAATAWAARCSSPAWPTTPTAACSTTWPRRCASCRSRCACPPKPARR